MGNKILSWRMGSGRREREGKSPWKGKVIGARSGGAGGGGRAGSLKGGPSESFYLSVCEEWYADPRLPGYKELQSEISSAQSSHQDEQRQVRLQIERDRAKADKFQGELGLTEEEHLAYALMLSRDEDEARLKSAHEANPVASSSTDSPGPVVVDRQEADDEDEALRRALEASLLDEGEELSMDHSHREQAEEEEKEEEEDDDNYYCRGSPSSRPYYSNSASSSPSLRPHSWSRGGSWTHTAAHHSPSPTFGSLHDQTDFPSMEASATSSPPLVGKGKCIAPVPPLSQVVKLPPPAVAWSQIARGKTSMAPAPPAVSSTPSSLAKSLQQGTAARVPMTREEQEAEELRLVLEMSLKDL